MLWSVTVGKLLDYELKENCIGNRLRSEEFSSETFTAFTYYLPEYNRWRDQAINVSLITLKAGNDILLIL